MKNSPLKFPLNLPADRQALFYKERNAEVLFPCGDQYPVCHSFFADLFKSCFPEPFAYPFARIC